MNQLNADKTSPDKTVRSSPSYFEFHIARKIRDYFGFDKKLFSLEGEAVFGSFADSQELALLLNKRKDGQAISAAELYAMGLLDEINHFLIESYRKQLAPELLKEIEKELKKKYGSSKVTQLLQAFIRHFPPLSVYSEELSEKDYLKGKSGTLSNKEIALEEILLLWLDNNNPAYQPIKELIDDEQLQKSTIYSALFKNLDEFFRHRPSFGPDNLPLLEMLRQPAKLFPHSLTAQLQFIRERWQDLIEPLLARILIGMDFIREEEKARLAAAFSGPGPTQVIEFDTEEEFEEERFSADLDWMPRLVLIAKSTYVWLDQLSKQYERPITRLDHIPDEELDRLAKAGFSGLWLIGVWERSRASQRIKQIAGNPEAMASAYSLDRYEIAGELGGEEAFRNLKERAMRRGIRLGSDMVPNHMGIDSQWVIYHPDWFVQIDNPPFPSYSFTGPDLSDDERVGIFIEDGYWNRTDAAVVFKRVDRHTGDVRYIYHGNDGTSMPWNDTAQLNYLLAEVREAVMQTILDVARKFPIIRFDAAMTLAKKHFQRLWFPEPGRGGDIPSRALFAMRKEEFNRVFPTEFWREVVDRVQQEVPDTLLLAEAFWLMESYFVRTLGMHRVYNSAFMNMLKNEENDKYRKSLKNILEFNPQILKRYVNFMNNPDEDTAVAQFGKNDKYFGVCVLMCTMPGLPMFGHGQVEGFEEKYGMEYRKAYWDEQPDPVLIQRHEREIFPLLRVRYRFADVDNFYLYDFFRPDGSVNENVFVYSNLWQEERSLVVYHNKFEETDGWINISSGVYRDETLLQKSLMEALDLTTAAETFICFRDLTGGLEYLRPASELEQAGLHLYLSAYRYHVFGDFRQVQSTKEKPYRRLYEKIGEQGVASIEESLDELLYEPLYFALREAINPGSLRWLAGGLKKQRTDKEVLATFNEKLSRLLTAFSAFDKLKYDQKKLTKDAQAEYLAGLKAIYSALSGKTVPAYVQKTVKPIFGLTTDKNLTGWRILITLPFISALYRLYGQKAETALSPRKLYKAFIQAWKEMKIEDDRVQADFDLITLLSIYPQGLTIDNLHPLHIFFEDLLNTSAAIRFLRINLFEGVVYFNKERFEEVIQWLFLRNYIWQIKRQTDKKKAAFSGLLKLNRLSKKIIKTAETSGYRKDVFLKLLIDII